MRDIRTHDHRWLVEKSPLSVISRTNSPGSGPAKLSVELHAHVGDVLRLIFLLKISERQNGNQLGSCRNIP